MNAMRTGAILALTGLLATAVPAAPALADGAASTRNIIGGAAVIGGALLIINHNRKVHQKEAEYQHAQQQAEAERNQAQASYESASSSSAGYQQRLAATNRELASYRRTLALQHSEIVKLRHEVALTRPAGAQSAAFVQPAPAVRAPAGSEPATTRVSSVSYGWGRL